MTTASRVARQMMRAIRVREFGGVDKMVCEKDVPIPKPADNEVLIKVSAAGVNPVDTYIRSGAYAALPSLPFTPGQDTAGVVQEVGSKVKDFKEGDRVLTVRAVSGAYAEYATAQDLYVAKLSPNLSFAQGAAIGIPYYTAYRALCLKAKIRAGETVLIHGASGAVGVAATQLAHAYGLTVIGTAGTQEGLDLVKAMGADLVFNHREANYQDQILKATDGKGVNVIVEMLANVNLQSDLTMLQFGGRVVVVGCRGTVEINPRLTMMKESCIMGMSLMTGSEAEWKETRAALEAGQTVGWVRPQVAHAYTLEQAGQSHTDVMDNKGTLGKLVIDLEK